MRIELAVKLALELMKKHKLASWSLTIDHDRNFAGYTIHKNKEIGLSKYFLELNNKKEVRDTILHEIAHALLPEGVDHTTEWKKLALKLGARPYYDGTIERAKKLPTKIYKRYGLKRNG